MNSQLNHEKLEVYRRALDLCVQVECLASKWGDAVSVSDHLSRAAISIVENLAQACAASGGSKSVLLDYALGSTLECAACLDVAVCRELSTQVEVEPAKRDVFEIFCMLIGLRRSWQVASVHEQSAVYDKNNTGLSFHHERLDVYQASLSGVTSLSTLLKGEKINRQTTQRLDSLSSGIVLNIAEGNGRYAKLDHARFLGIAYRQTICLAAQLDLCVVRETVQESEIRTLKHLLVRIASMTASMAGWRHSRTLSDKVDDKVDDEVPSSPEDD